MDFSTLLVAGIPLIAVIFGLVEFSKTFGLSGKWLTALSLGLGVGGGIAYQIATNGLPLGFAGWFTVVIFGLAVGLSTSGLYNFVNVRAPAVTAAPPEPLPDPVMTALKNFGAELLAATASATPAASMIPPVETGTIDPTQPKGESQELAQG